MQECFMFHLRLLTDITISAIPIANITTTAPPATPFKKESFTVTVS